MLGPNEIASKNIEIGIKKSKLSNNKKILLSILAGMFIGFGAHGSLTIMQSLGNIDIGLSKFLGALVFPVGLMLVVMAGGELFTGNNLMVLSLLDGKIEIKDMISSWLLVYIGNFLGSLFLAFLVYKSGLVNESIKDLSINIAIGKIEMSFIQALIRGFLCNILVVLAVWMASGSESFASKILSIWFPIMLFTLIGYEHSIANMFYIPLGKFLGANISFKQMWINNLIPVTIGNVLGGGLFISVIYYFVYIFKKEEEKDDREELRYKEQFDFK
ncbi:formate/nitrite transporter family protein [Anaerosalibacter bizertensis]|uniref:Formate/nitrite transporter family protein n=1 Tax=Anaerosalibacter bizertensis TaxID=932217 RepID=A0A844FK10_9FIRM|nr:formate/nitrite transporter family protein [Anaerosalibacter bizertensis]MBU5294719.1 formate/nitrite transporter family protein [Anaerosalibacter bizertensis]MSS44226.1 formate/nitrite transporter family protein [Anaerosalibacter bizertensis]HHV25590.1 formate/nitrite transporter family protein [Tissierellia bacterium]